MTTETHIGRLRLTNGSDVLFAGRGSAQSLEQAVRSDPSYAAIASGWATSPLPLRHWAATFGADDLSLDIALHVDDAVPFVTAILPEEADDPLVPIPRLFDPTETAELPRLTFDAYIEVPDTPKGTIPVLLDAAAIFGLPERLEGAGLDRLCLFSGAALDELGQAAPWLAALAPDADLLTEAASLDACLGFWPDEDLAALGKHLKRYTKMREADGKWIYFRLASRSFHDWIRLHPAGPFPKGFFRAGKGVLLSQPDAGWMLAHRTPEVAELRHDEFLEQFTRFARMQLRRRFVERAAAAISQQLGEDVSLPRAALHYRVARDAGYMRERALVRMMEAGLRLDRVGLVTTQIEQSSELLAHRTSSDVHRSGAVLEAARRYAGDAP